jgi:hypothetical protein
LSQFLELAQDTHRLADADVDALPRGTILTHVNASGSREA